MTRDELAQAVEAQARNCAGAGSPLYARLLELLHRDLETGGPVWRFLQPHALASSISSLLPLRFLALFHGLALKGVLPELASCYPSCGGIADADRAYAAIVPAIDGRSGGDDLLGQIPMRVQTNEAGRSRALLVGFRKLASIAEWRTLSWRLLEPGSSAGLNLYWDRFGLPGTPQVQIVERRGCDVAPIPATSDALLPFVWPDQPERFQFLAQALQCVQGEEVLVDAADALEWTEHHLREPRHGMLTILFHSIFWMYLDPASRVRMESLIREAGARASPGAAFAWLRMEVGGPDHAVVDLDLWPPPQGWDGATLRLARSGFHGTGVIEL